MKTSLLTAAALAAAALTLAHLAACDGPKQTTPSGPTGEPDATYTTRGKVEMLPDPRNAASEFVVHHEPIDDFKNPSGTKGMNSMSMPFPLARAVSLDGIAVGDVVEITFSHWSKPGNMGYQATKVVELPPDTKLFFGKAGEERPSDAASPAPR
jgi:Cu/Ag efflux protein CusF